MPHAVQTGALLVVGLDDGPRCVSSVRVEEHRLLGRRVLVPLVERLPVNRRQLPLLQNVLLASLEAALLLLSGNREPVLEQQNPAPDEHALQLGSLAHELQVLLAVAEPHDALDTAAVVPRAVEQHDLATPRQMANVALEEPLGPLVVGRLVERHDPRTPRIEMLREPLDGPTLAGGISALEQDNDLPVRCLHPVLHLQQFHLKCSLRPLVGLTGELPFVGILARLEQMSDNVTISVGHAGGR